MVQTCSILLLSLITTLFSPSFTFITKDFEIQDLQGNGADFLADASYWQFTGLLGDATSMICNNTYLLAGYRILGNTSSIQRIYDVPQPHNSVFISFSLWIMSSWTDSNTITVIISDGTTEFFNQNVLATAFTGKVGFSSQKTTCNGTLDLLSLPITIQTPHTGNQLYFTIQTSMQAIPYNQSFGFRNLNLTISTQTISTSSFCVASFLGFSNQCSCPLGNFKSGKKCYTCDSTCSQCLGNGSTNCSLCAPNYYYNGALCINCDPSCTTCSGPGVNNCLTCPAGSYLYSTGKCLPDCPEPFIIRVRKNITFCDAPCGQDDFFYANNNTCQSECPSPYTTGIKESGQFCDCPSASLEKYQVCLSQSQFEFVQTVDTITDGAQTAASVLLVASSVISIGNPRVFLFSTISKMLQYIKYLDINYTPRLQVILNNWNSTMLSIDTGINVPHAAQNVTEYDPPPFVFARFDMEPSFIKNYWDGLLCLGILLAVLTFTIIKEYLAKRLNKNQKIYPWFKKLRLTVQNFLVIYFYEQFGDVVFASVINFESLKPGAAFSSFSCSISTITAAVLLLSGVIIFGIYIRLIYQHQRNKKVSVKPDESEPLQEKYEGAQVLFRDFNDMSALQQGILLIYILRESTFYIILTTLYDHPFVQMILLVIINIAAIIYLILKSPFKEKFETVEHASFEGILLTANIILLTLSVLDMKKAEAWLIREILCFIVLIIIIIFNFVLLGFFAVKGVILLKKAYKAWKKKRNSQQNLVKVWPNSPPRVLLKKKKLMQIKHFNSDFEADSENEKRLTADLEKDKTWNSPTSNSISSTRNLEDAFTALSISTFKRIRNRNLRRREREGTIFRGDPIENVQFNQDSIIK